MMIIKILTFIVLLCFNLTLMDMGLWADTAGIPPGTDVQQEKTEKKEEEKNKKEEEKDKKLKRNWTDKDLKKIRKERLNITEVPPDPDEKKKKGEKKYVKQPAKVESTTKKETIDPKKTEKYWRDRKNAIVARIKKNEEEIERLERRIPELRSKLEGVHFDSPDRHSERVPLIQEFEDSKKKLQNYKRGLKTLKQSLEDLYDEARKEGALPGWLRD